MSKPMPMTVLHNDSFGNIELVCIDVMKVDFIENEGRRFVYHIGDDKYYQITNKSEIEEALSDKGFDVLDRPYLVNLNRIKFYDRILAKVYFVSKPDKNSKFATIARIKQEFVERLLKRFIQLND